MKPLLPQKKKKKTDLPGEWYETGFTMQSLPPIHSPVTNTNAKNKSGAELFSTPDVPSLAATLKARGTTASAADGINRNQLRQEAGRRVQHITHGVAEQETYLNMLQHIREQFAHTSQQPLQPLVLPPQWPSTARPRNPQTAKFSRGIALYKNVQKRSDAALPPLSAARGSQRGEKEEHDVVAALDGVADATGSYVATELPSTSTNFAHAHHWEMMDTEDRAFFQRRLLDAASGSTSGFAEGSTDKVGQRGGMDLMRQELDLSPLDGLPTLEEKVAYLSELEGASRQHLMAYEKWDQQVVSEMMAVRYVTFVLKPCMDALRIEETEEREKIYQHEDRVSFYLFHESPLAVAIEEEMKAMKARELQLHRILGVTPASQQQQQQRRSQPSGGADETSSVIAEGELDPSRSSYAAFRAPNPPTPIPSTAANTRKDSRGGSSGGVPAPEARRILQQYVRQRHGPAIEAAVAATEASPLSPYAMPKTWSPASNATYPGTSGRDPIRRSSALVLPPAPSAHGPRRNAVGIADYVALLDECMTLRDHIVRAEQQSRDDLNRSCYEEQQVVLEWQRRRMHLERLMYWRHQREEAVQDELSALTEVNVGAQLNPKVLLLLELLEGEEEDARSVICTDEQHWWENEVWLTSTALRHQRERMQLEREYWATLEQEVQLPEAETTQHFVVDDEEGIRRCIEGGALHSLRQELDQGMKQLHVLWKVSTCPERCAALTVLQSAFRRSLRGKLGWRVTNSAIGREINDARNTRKISAGKRTLQSFKDALRAEEAELQQQQLAQEIREQHVLFAGEAADRVAISSEQDLIRQGLRRAAVLHVAEALLPVFWRLSAAEEEARMELEVEEEVDGEALRRSHALLTDIITYKARTRYDETTARKALVAEERAVWRGLRSAEGDACEELRLDAEARAAMLLADRSSFATAALQASRDYRDNAFLAYVRQMAGVELELLDHRSSDSAERWSICAEESTAATRLFSEMTVQACEVYAQTMLRQRQAEMDRVHRQALSASETEKRADILLSEAIEWEALKPLLMETLSGPVRELIIRRGAVNAISTWYRALRDGDIGRAVSRQHLHDDLVRHREERHLKEQQVAQRLHAQQVRGQLDELMREVQQEEVAALQQRIDILVHREEPRGRDEVESMQEIVFGIVVRNAEANTAVVRSQLVNTEALLWQQESYERKLLVKAARRAFKELMERERRQLSEDYFATRIQRTWRAYAARKKHAAMVAEQHARLTAVEQQARASIVLEELEEASLDLYKTCEAAFLFYTHIQESLSQAYEQLCLTILASTSAQEWQARAALLWEMRYDLCDACLCSEEERARHVLASEFDKPFLLQEQLLQTEGQKRRMLEEERTQFLLRILSRGEQTQRSLVAAEELAELAVMQRAANVVTSSATLEL
jgi:hypothetical protein